MGIYFNPGNQGFRTAVRSKIYVDKTGVIAHTNERINTEERFVCVSRPRRFGKSMTLNMLAAYYSRGCDSADLFHGYRIEKDETFQEHLNRYDVLYLNMQQFLIEADGENVTEYLEREALRELRKEYGRVLARQDMGLAAALREIFVETGSWYDGYRFRKFKHIYNPRSVVAAMGCQAFPRWPYHRGIKRPAGN